MAWLKSKSGEQATDRKDLLDIMVALCTERHVASAVVAAGGTTYSVGDTLTDASGTHDFVVQCEVASGGASYVVGEVLTISGGTASVTATATVTKVSSGAVTEVVVLEAGAYSSNPSNSVSTTASASGTGCTLDLIFKTRHTAEFEVLTVDGGGAVLTVRVASCGIYSADPSNPIATTVSPAGGSGCTLTLTMANGGWNIQRSNAPSEREVILQGTGAGSDEIYVGVRTFLSPANGYKQWELAGFTGFDANLAWASQAGISPGRHESPTNGGCWIPLDDVTMDYWFAVDSNRIIMVAKIGSQYPNMYMGFLNPFSTTSEYPYPLYIAGCTSDEEFLIGTSGFGFGGLTNPIAKILTETHDGPGEVRFPGGSWRNVANREADDDAVTNRIVMPSQDIGLVPSGADLYFDTNSVTIAEWDDFIPNTGNPGATTKKLMPTPDSGGHQYVMIPATLAVKVPVEDRQLLGEMDGVFWYSNVADFLANPTPVALDTITVGSDVYRVFPNCNKTDQFNFLAIKEE